MNNYLLVGNPNVGKTTVFNSLTNSVATVGNYSGVTVEKRIGKLINKSGNIIDLPGVYSLIPSTIDEGVTAKVLIEKEFNGIINVVDVNSLVRHLHLTIQLIEFGSPTTLVLNFYDEFEKLGRTLNRDVLEETLGIPVIKSIATKSLNSELIIDSVNSNTKNKFRVDYGILEKYVDEIKALLPHNKLKRRFIALSLLEGNDEIVEYVKTFPNGILVLDIVDRCNEYLKSNTDFNNSRVAIFAKRREYIQELLAKASYSKTNKELVTNSSTNRIDKKLTSPLTGIPIFLMLLVTIYFLTFNILGNPISDYLDGLFFGVIDEKLMSLFETIGITGMSEDLIVNGVYTGTASVLVFLPQVVILFLFLTTLESIGYLSRVSVLFDGILSKVGLNGKSIIPLITGVGCNVPAIMGTRVIDSKKERLITLLTIPFVSCSARIPIYLVFSEVFFGSYAFLAMLFLQFFGIIVVVLVSKLLNSTIFKKDVDYLVLEIPPYRLPQIKYVLKVSYNKGKSFVKNVAKFVAIGTVIVWFLSSFNFSGYGVDQFDSFMGKIGGAIAPFLAPLGFGTWQAASSLISGFMAKELVVSSMAIFYDVNESGLGEVLANHFTTASAASFLIFNALYIPCIATVGAIKKETDSWKWTFFSIALSTIVAYIFALITYGIFSIFT